MKYLEFELAYKFVFSKKNRLQISSYLSFLGLVLSIGLLVVAMAVMSGFEKTLQQAMIDVTGHIQVIKRSKSPDEAAVFENKLRKLHPEIQSAMRFVFVESIAASKGQVLGTMLQGLDFQKLPQTLNFQQRVIHGELNCPKNSKIDDVSSALMCAYIGKGLAKRFQLKVGDEFNIVVPIADSFDPAKFRRKKSRLRVQAVLDYGKNEYNERLILSEIHQVQALAEIGDRYSGLILKLNSDTLSKKIASKMQSELGLSYYVRDWREVNENLFEAVQLERNVIFFVVFILVIVSAFNVSSSLYVFTIQRYGDIGLLKALGFSQRKIRLLFQIIGLLISTLGTGLGLLLGFILSMGFEFLQTQMNLISGSIYKVDQIHVNLRFIDLLAIVILTNLVCSLAVFFPAKKGSELSVVEGMKYGT